MNTLKTTAVCALALIAIACVDSPPEPDLDADGDGFPSSLDCDDTTAAISPAATESCDSIDNDCDGIPGMFDDDALMSGYVDADGDGYAGSGPLSGCVGTLAEAIDDCDDDDPETYPDAPEAFNGIDNDCDGHVDGDGEFCTTLLDPAPPPNGCVDGEIFDGDVITGTTTGGGNNADTLEYGQWNCNDLWPGGYGSPDRAYLIDMAGFSHCSFRLTKDCGSELDLFAMKSDPGDSCPLTSSFLACGHSLNSHDSFDEARLTVSPGVIPTNDKWFAVIVDSRGDVEANFTLIVDCQE